MNYRKSIGTKGVAINQPVSGVGYVIIPFGVTRDKYVKNCLKNNRVCIRTEQGDFYKNCLVSDDLLQKIKFPDDPRSIGSGIVWLNKPKHNTPILVSIINLNNELGEIFEENQLRIFRESDQGFIDIDGRVNGNGLVSLDLNIEASGDSVSEFNIKVTNDNGDASVNLEVSGDVNIYSKNNTKLKFKGDFDINFVGEDLEPISHIRFNENDGFEIFVDSQGDGEDAVLGNTLVSYFETLFDELDSLLSNLSQLTVPTPVGPSGVPINLSSFVSNKTNLISLKNEVEQILSENLKID